MEGMDEEYEVVYSEGDYPVVTDSTIKYLSMTSKFKLNQSNKKQKPSLINKSTSTQITTGDIQISRYICLKSINNQSINQVAAFYPNNNSLLTSQIDQWIDFISPPPSSSLSLKSKLNDHLRLRSFIVGHSPSLADFSFFHHFDSLPDSDPASSKSKNGKKGASGGSSDDLLHFSRWFRHISSLLQRLSGGSSSSSSSASPDGVGKSRIKTGSKGSFDKLSLPGAADFKVVTRFPPEPSGFLHIGHAKAILLNEYYARRYKGTMLLRFDDTNPQKEKQEFEDSILKDVGSLGVHPDRISHSSDHFAFVMDRMTELIKKGLAYVDVTSVEEIRRLRENFLPSPCRDNDVEKNMGLWLKMQKGEPIEIETEKYDAKSGKVDKIKTKVSPVVRAKIDPASKNGVMRDPSLFRSCPDIPHHRTGLTFKVYPLYDFSCPVVDSIEGVTHALRSNEFHDRNDLYEWVLDAIGATEDLQEKVGDKDDFSVDRLRSRPHIQDFSRLNFSYVLLSKRKLAQFVNKGLVEGWDDPRFPTVQGMLRLGLQVEALREFLLSQGASKNINVMDIDKLWAFNRKLIDPVVPRHTSVDQANPCQMILTNFADFSFSHKTANRHPKNPDLGLKVVSYSARIFLDSCDATEIKEGEEITLMNWGNAIVDSMRKIGDSFLLLGHLNPSGSVKATKKKLTWLPFFTSTTGNEMVDLTHKPPHLVNLMISEFFPLITKKKLEADDKFEDHIQKVTRLDKQAFGDPLFRLLSHGEIIQIERKGYFMVDEPFISEDKPVKLFNIPDGHHS